MRFMLPAAAILLAACSDESGKAADAALTPDAAAETAPAPSAPSLEAIWVAEGFSDPEGVALAPDGAYFISNVAGEGEAKDGAGWISKLSADGGIIAARFIDGLNGPKGMAVRDGVLYVADIDAVKTFDTASGTPGDVIAIPGATFLNDAALWRGEVYVSDSGTGRIWRLAPDGPQIWREGEELDGVNGLLADGERMLVSTMTSGGLYEANSNGGWREIASGMTDADGIGVVSKRAGGGYLVSSWPGEIYYVGADGSVTPVLNTRAAGVFQNDLTIFGDIVIVPNWKPGTVTAWKFRAN